MLIEKLENRLDHDYEQQLERVTIGKRKSLPAKGKRLSGKGLRKRHNLRSLLEGYQPITIYRVI